MNLEQGCGASAEAGFVHKPEVRTRQYVKAKNLVRDFEIYRNERRCVSAWINNKNDDDILWLVQIVCET